VPRAHGLDIVKTAAELAGTSASVANIANGNVPRGRDVAVIVVIAVDVTDGDVSRAGNINGLTTHGYIARRVIDIDISDNAISSAIAASDGNVSRAGYAIGGIPIDRHIPRSVCDITVIDRDVSHPPFDISRPTADGHVTRSIVVIVVANGDVSRRAHRIVAVSAADGDISRTAATYRDISNVTRDRHSISARLAAV
jgi:hypothetical protein